MKKIRNEIFDKERSLYGIKDTLIENTKFMGEADGESPLKETNNIQCVDCLFSLRYPLWHNSNSCIINSTFSETCRAPFWYSKNTKFLFDKIIGVKFLRECENITIENSDINSLEFAWKTKGLKITDSKIVSEYPFFNSKDIELDKVDMKGKYSFQYVDNLHITNSNLDTKDAFWHTKNVLIENSIIKGEYLGWYSENLTFVNCKIVGTQPLCYAKNIVFKNCEMEGCDLAFENSTIDIECNSVIDSIKNPIEGKIIAKGINEQIFDEFKKDGKVEIIIK